MPPCRFGKAQCCRCPLIDDWGACIRQPAPLLQRQPHRRHFEPKWPLHQAQWWELTVKWDRHAREWWVSVSGVERIHDGHSRQRHACELNWPRILNRIKPESRSISRTVWGCILALAGCERPAIGGEHGNKLPMRHVRASGNFLRVHHWHGGANAPKGGSATSCWSEPSAFRRRRRSIRHHRSPYADH